MKWAWAALLVACGYPKLAPVGDGPIGDSPIRTGDGGDAAGSGGTAGVVAWYHLNEAQGPLADASGAHHDAAIVGAQIDFESGWAGGGFHTNGALGHASAPPSPSLAVKHVTVETWLSPATAPVSKQIAVAKGSDFALGLNSAVASVDLVLANGTAISLTSTTQAAMGAWIHVAATWDGTTAALYVNGALEASITPAAGGALQASNASLDLGPSFKGVLDETRVFGDARTPAQILDDATFVGWWTLDEGSGAIAHDTSGNLRDLPITNAMWGAGVTSGHNALACDGTVYAEMASDPGLTSVGPTTVEAWVDASTQPTPTGNANAVVIKMQGPGVNGLTSYGLGRCCNNGDNALYMFANYPNSMASIDSAIDSNVLSATASWHHLVGTYNGSALCLYVDGGLQGCNAGIGALGGGAGPFVICAADQGISAFYGRVAGVRVYTRELTASEVRAHYFNP